MSNELTHHGVEGMRWGKRNGPPYPLDSDGKADLRAQKKAAKAGAGKAKKESLHKRVSKMSDADLEKKIKRIKMENEYKKLKRSDIERGSDYVKGLGLAAAGAFTLGLALTGGKKGSDAVVATFLKNVCDPAVWKAIYAKK